MKIRFLVDYRGVLTDESFFPAGAVVTLPAAPALVAAGRAEYVESDISDLTRAQLRERAKEAGLAGYGRLSKTQLIERLREQHGTT